MSWGSTAQVLRAPGVVDQCVAAADPLASDLGRLRAGELNKKRVR